VSSSIEPLDQVSQADVRSFLERNAGLAGSIVDWKYYDDAFDPRQNRGFVMVREGRVLAFYGLIPFNLVAQERTWESAWPCDWYVEDPGSAGAAGLILLRHVIEAAGHMVHIRGNEATRKIYTRLASKTVEDGAVELCLSLRLADVLRKVRRRLRLPDRRYLGPIERIRVHRVAIPADGEAVGVADGVAGAVADLAEATADTRECAPRYDRAYLDWLVGRCPSLESFSCYAGEGPRAAAGALFWSQPSADGAWRVALWGRGDADREQAAVLKRGIHEAWLRGGTRMEALVSRLDTKLLAVFGNCGFAECGRHPIHIFAAKNSRTPVEEPRAVTFLDGDNLNLF
jgi:hypothetical protein